MERKSRELEGNDHVIDMWKVDTERLASMQHKISENPKLLSKAADKGSCCIFRVPKGLIVANGNAYQPRIVSIGPYHCGQSRLKMIEEHKWRYLGSLLSRTQTKGLNLEELLKAIAPLESEARECYSENIQLDSHDFIEMMVLDGCFIIELFRKVPVHFEQEEPDDPLITMAWILPFLSRDFLMLENQIPFFILQRLFELSKLPEEKSTPTLSSLAMKFFNYWLRRAEEVIPVIQQESDTGWKHLLDLVRSSFIQSLETKSKQWPKEFKPRQTRVIPCVSMLRRAGIKIKQGGNDKSFLHVTFRHGVIEMPTITMNDCMSPFLLNCVAFEQCYSGCSNQFTTYVTLLDYLINTDRDVEYLCDQNIIENHFGTEGEVARFINNTGKDVAFYFDSCYLSQLFNEVRQYYQNKCHMHWASFKYKYFDTPWSFISALAAFILLVLAVAQTYFAAYQYADPQWNFGQRWQRAKQQLLYKLGRFEKLAELDPVELEKRMLDQEEEEDETFMEEDDCEDEDSEVSYKENDFRELVFEALCQTSVHDRRQIPEDLKKLVSDLIVEEERELNSLEDRDMVIRRVCKRLELWKEVESNTIDMMIEEDFSREDGGWKKNVEQITEMAGELELAIFGFLVEEFSEELVC